MRRITYLILISWAFCFYVSPALAQLDANSFYLDLNGRRQAGIICPEGNTLGSLPPLSGSSQLEEAAQRHADDLALSGSTSNTGSDGSTFSQRIEDTGYPLGFATQLLFFSNSPLTNEQLLDGWIGDAPNCDALIGDFEFGTRAYTDVGIAVNSDPGSAFAYNYVLLLALPEELPYYLDADGDGYGDPDHSVVAAIPPAGYVLDNTDCNDADASVFPSAPELCDGLDNNCDGAVDENLSCLGLASLTPELTEVTQGTQVPYTVALGSAVPSDQDGEEVSISVDLEGVTVTSFNVFIPGGSSSAVFLYTPSEVGVYTVVASFEGEVLVATLNSTQGERNYYHDNDQDGYGDPNDFVIATSPPPGYVDNGQDCNDNDPAINPAAIETCDAIDNNCNGAVDEGLLCEDDFYSALNARRAAGIVCPEGNNLGSLPPLSVSAQLEEAAQRHADDLALSGSTSNTGSDGSTFSQRIEDTGYPVGFATQLLFFSHSALTNEQLLDGWIGDAPNCDALIGDFEFGTRAYTDVGIAVNDDPGSTFAYNYVLLLALREELPYYLDADGDGFGDASHFVLAAEAPSGYVDNDLDCDDSNSAVNPEAAEICDGVDNNCDGSVDEGVLNIFFADTDSDGFGDPNNSVQACSAPPGFVADNTDCNDADGSINPASTEVCDGVDNDCDGSVDEGVLNIFFADTDSDGFGDPNNSTQSCSAPPGFVADNTDCHDADPDINPGAIEVCDGVDNDCDGSVDEGVLNIFFADTDGDGFGDPNNSTQSCSAPPGFVADNTDCNDADPNINPAATEVCDGVDNDCDGSVDEGVLNTFFADTDSDGFGDPNNSTQSCSAPPGFVADNTDCNDADGSINPGAPEICDGVDNNCDGNIDEGVLNIFFADTDSDGFGDPNNSTQSCSAPPGFVADNTDCNDADPNINPGAIEVCDGVDNDCDGLIDDQDPSVTGQSTWFADADGDLFGDPDVSVVACNQPPGFVADNTDCNDADPNINPGAQEICDGIDNDCDGLIDDNDPSVAGQSTWFADADGDLFGNPGVSVLACNQPPGFVADNTDCNDADPNINPAAQEICDGIDNDCDGLIDDDDPSVAGQSTWFADADGDLFGDPDVSVVACNQPPGFVADNTDCHDADPNINPVAQEICDGIDNDCDGLIDDDDPSVTGQPTWYADVDGDGFGDPNVSLLACVVPAGYVADASDNCPFDANKIEPGACGCGVVDLGTDADKDGIDDGCDPVFSVGSAAQALADLVLGMEPKAGIGKALTTKLEEAQNYCSNGDPSDAVGVLGAFINQTNAKRGKEFSDAEADLLIAEANTIIAAIEAGESDCFSAARLDSDEEGLQPGVEIDHGSYPNPFNTSTLIHFNLLTSSKVSLAIYDLYGNRVAYLVNDTLPAGNHEFTWEATGYSMGIYFYQLRIGEAISIRKLVLSKD